MKTTHINARKRPSTSSKIDPNELSAKRRAASAKGLSSRWGGVRGKSKQVRVGEAAFTALQSIPDRDRNRVATDAILSAVKTYKRLGEIATT